MSNILPQQPTRKTPFLEKVAQFQVAEDLQKQQYDARPTSRSKSPQRVGKPGNTDSGYHGMMTEDEMELDAKMDTTTDASHHSNLQKIPLREDQPRPQPRHLDTAEPGAISDDSFVSAKERLLNQSSTEKQNDEPHQTSGANEQVDAMEVDEEVAENDSKRAQMSAVADADVPVPESDLMEHDMEEDASRSPSEISSPAKLVQRKSSFTFAPLPPREPFTMQSQLGTRISQAEGRGNGAHAVTISKGHELSEVGGEFPPEVSEASKVLNKTSTQSLHEFRLLDQTEGQRASKGIPNGSLQSQPTQSQSPSHNLTTSQNHVSQPAEDSDDDWITLDQRTRTESGGANLARKDEITAQQETISAFHPPPFARQDTIPNLSHQTAVANYETNQIQKGYALQSTTPAGSPASKKHYEGTLSATKKKFCTLFGLATKKFTLSAIASDAAKHEAHNNAPSRSPEREAQDKAKPAMHSNKERAASPSRPLSVCSTVSESPSKKSTKYSTKSERKEKELKAQQEMAEKLKKVRGKESQRAAKEQQARPIAAQQQQHAKQIEQPSVPSSDASIGNVRSPVPPKSMLPAGKPRALGKPVRAVREPAQSAKPAPVTVRLGSQSSRFGSSSTLNKSLHGSAAPPPPPKSTLRPTSAHGIVRSSTAPNAARLKDWGMAARKKEAAAKEAAAKEAADRAKKAADQAAATDRAKQAEQKREMERELEREQVAKQVAKAKEDRRVEEERKAAEQRRLQDAKLAAQRQERREDQQRQHRHQEQQRAKAHELVEKTMHERAQQAATHPRGDVAGISRPLIKSSVPDVPIQINPAKPAKRQYTADEESSSQTYQHPGMQRPGLSHGPPNYQQNQSKRRRTDEKEPMDSQEERPSVKAPPMRPSHVSRKVSPSIVTRVMYRLMRLQDTSNKTPYGYALATAAPNVHKKSSTFRSVANSQHPQNPPKLVPGTHPSQMVQVVGGRIPFAENANPPGAPSTQYLAPPQHHGVENAHPGQNKYKTPIRPVQAPKSAKSSPLYPNGDLIALPEIQTDSEDEDDDDDDTGFRAPSWVASPALRDLLTQQQLVDPETVFGPIGELKMDEVFRNGKNQDRLKRFRDRGSSAAWIESGDAVTSAEKRKDMALRERVVRDGGWRYDPNI